MKNEELKMHLPSLDNLFTTQEERDNPKILEVTELPINLIKDFPNHPFKVLDDESMDDLVESISINGVIIPVVVRKEDDGSYSMIAGHRRKHAASIAGLEKIPSIILKVNDDQATILMVDTNINQRLSLLASEKAFAYKMKLDAIKHQGKKLEDTSRPLVEKLEKILSADLVGKEYGESARTIQRYVRITKLIPELLELVDEKKMGLRPAVEISYISKKNQKLIYESFKYNEATSTLGQAKLLRNLDKNNELTLEKIETIMEQEKPNQKEQFRTSYDNIRHYFPSNYSNKQIDSKIIELLEIFCEEWKQNKTKVV